MREKIVLISLCIANLNYVLYNSIGLNALEKNSIRIIAIIVLLFSFLIQKESIKITRIDMVWFFLSMTALFGFGFNEKILNFTYLLLVFIVARSISINKFYKYFNYFNLFIVLLLILFLQLGFTHNATQVIGDRVRSTFGFNNVNAFSNLSYSMFMVFLLSRRIIKIRHIVFLLSMLIVTYMYTDTRSVLYSIIIFLSVYILFKFFIRLNIYKTIIFRFTLIFVSFVPVFLSLASSFLLKYFPALDKTLSARLSLNTYYIEYNSIKNLLLGGTFVRDVDNGYLLLLYSLGFLFFIFSLILVIKSLNILIHKGDIKSVSFIISFMYFNALESLIVRPELFIGLLFWLLIYKTITEH